MPRFFSSLKKLFGDFFAFSTKHIFSLTGVEVRIYVFPFVAELLDLRGRAFGTPYIYSLYHLGRHIVDDGAAK